MARSTVVSVILALLLSPCVLFVSSVDAAVITLPIPTIKIDLTIQYRRQLLRKSEQLREERPWPVDRQHPRQDAKGGGELHLSPRRSLEGIESAIQTVAESHLAAIYSDQFSEPPSQVLLTVVTDNDDDDEDVPKNGGIRVRSAFLGGVVSFPAHSSSSGAPTRTELERVTLAAFAIPGMGEPFLKSLQEVDHPALGGLLLIGAEEVRKDGYGGDGWDDPKNSGNVDNANDPTARHSDGGNSSMNIWAVAAVAALGAMFLVIVMCTSILYCDWRKRRDRRERKREARQANHHANVNGHNRAASSKKSKGSVRSGSSNRKDDGVHLLQIDVPAAASGETEEINVSPSTQNSRGENNGSIEVPYLSSSRPSSEPPVLPSNSNSNSGRGALMMGKINANIIKSKRSLAKSKTKSKAADAQLREADSPANDKEYTAADFMDAPQESPPSVAEHSIGEDTTALYPSVHRHRAMSKDKDAMSDFDGYSMDGMSAVDGGFGDRQYGTGTSTVGGSSASANNAKRSRDMYYTGDVPRDFDSVWDDESKVTTDEVQTLDGSLDMYATNRSPARNNNNDNNDAKDREAYADLNNSLNRLVENEYENSSQSQSAANASSTNEAANIHDFDSESESGGSNKQHGAFTLELLGKGHSKTNMGKRGVSAGSSTAASQEDEDSILGDMYRDETSDVLGLVGNDDNNEEAGEGGKKNAPSGNDSVDSTPSWAAPIQSAMRTSMGIFRAASSSSSGPTREENAEDSSPQSKDGSDSQSQRTLDKFFSSLSPSDDSSVGSGRSRGSGASANSKRSSKNKEGTPRGPPQVANEGARKEEDKALGLTNSMEEEVDEDPAAMIDNINSMLSECREILDTENTV